MNIEQMQSLVIQGESTNLEFKTSTAKLASAFATVCAFLNNKGGTVLIGVKDNGKIIGQDITDATRLEIANEIRKIEPAAFIDVDYIEVKTKKFVIVLHVNAGHHIPYIYDGRAFQRYESQTDKMSQHCYEQLLVQRGQLNHSWEEFVADGYDIDSLDHEEIYRTVLDGIAEKRIHTSIAKENALKILRQLDLLVDGKPKRAAVVLFAKEIKSHYAQCWLKMARFKGIDKSGDFIDNQQIYCNAFHMLEEADHFLRKHLPMASYFKPDRFKRVDKPALPTLAVREALVNAICHKDYIDNSGYISIAIFDDRVEIWNNGTLPSKLKLEDLKRAHDSILRNKLIAKVFYLRGYIETWGTGTTRMIDLCKRDAIPDPIFSERTGGFIVTFKLASPIGGKVIQQLVLTSRQQEILKILKKFQLSSVQLTKKLNGLPAVRTVQVELLQLENMGLIQREGKARATIWRLKEK